MMKRMFLAIALMAGVSAFAAEGLIIEKLSGGDYQKALSAVGRLEISGDKLVVKSLTGEELSQMSLTDVRKITFGEVEDEATGLISLVESAEGVKVFPNPAADFIEVQGGNGLVSILSLTGEVKLQSTASVISLKGLAQGAYLVLVNNQIFKIIKK